MISGLEVPRLGVGLGLRPTLEGLILAHPDAIDWLEVISERYMAQPAAQDRLRVFAERHRIVPHGIELSIGTDVEPDQAYLAALKELVELFDAPWFSDHLCFTRTTEFDLGMLTPLPTTTEVALSVARRIRTIQRQVGRPFLVENIAYHLRLPGGMSESEFISAVVEEADCGLLLDLANLFQNSVNHGYDPYDFLDDLPLQRVVQVHLAGGVFDASGRYHDTHSEVVPEPVWDLLEYVMARTDPAGVLLERDQNFERLGDILADLRRARSVFGMPA